MSRILFLTQVLPYPFGAEGIDLRDGENILLAADPASFAQATVRLLTDPTPSNPSNPASKPAAET